MKYMLAMLLLFSIGASAQTQVDSITVKSKLKLNGYRVTGVSNDTTTANQDSSRIMNEAATKRMILGRDAYRDSQYATTFVPYVGANRDVHLGVNIMYTNRVATDNSKALQLKSDSIVTIYTNNKHPAWFDNATSNFSGITNLYSTSLSIPIAKFDTISVFYRNVCYNNNISNTYTLHSLIDKQYADSIVATKGVGTITGVTSGTGLTGGGTSGTITVNADTGRTGIATSVDRIRDSSVAANNANKRLDSTLVRMPYTFIGRKSGSGTWTQQQYMDSSWWNGLFANQVRNAQTTGSSVGGSNSQIQFNNSGNFAGSSNLIWDNSNNRFGINITPSYNLDMSNTYVTGNDNTIFRIKNTTNPNSAKMAVQFEDAFGYSGQIGMANASGGGPGFSGAAGLFLYCPNVTNYAGGDISLIANSAWTGSSIKFGFASTVAMRLMQSGNLLMNTSTDDGVNKLQVNGSIKATQYRLSALNTAPINSSDTGTLGEIRITSSYIYLYTGSSWVRSAFSTF